MELLTSKAWDQAAWQLVALYLPKGLLLSLLLLAGGWLLRRASAAIRAAWWTVGALALLALPALDSTLPAWEVGAPVTPARLFEPGAGAAGGVAPSIAALLLVVWGTGVAFLLGRFATHLVRVWSVTRRAEPVSGSPLGAEADAARARLGIRRAVRVRTCTEIEIPMTWGVWHPVVLLPASADRWPTTVRRTVLRHELAHARRADYLGLLLLELCRIVHWPNPLAWWLARAGRREQEHACDDTALRSGIGAAEYARHLVAVGRSALLGRPRPVAALPILRRRSSLQRRVRAILEPDLRRGPTGLLGLLATGALVALLAAPVAALNPWGCPDEGPEAPASWIRVRPAPALEAGARSATARPPAETPRSGPAVPRSDAPTRLL